MTWKKVQGIIYCSLFFCYVSSCCHNGCSGHGTCSEGTCSCVCFSQYGGSDCSLRKCPLGRQWLGAASAVDSIHDTYAECSNVGLCDTGTGVCQCQAGFSGIACERLECPNDCSGNGVCISLHEAGQLKDDIQFVRQVEYTLWDQSLIYGCYCDRGFTGHDCSQRLCEYGDDPMTTTAEVDEIQVVDCTCAGVCSGSFYLQYEDRVTSAISFDASAATVGTKLEALSNLNQVTVSLTGGTEVCDSDGASLAITFTHNAGDLPKLRILQGTLASSTGVLSIQVLHSGQTSIHSVVSQTGTKERVVCNGRGTCDSTTGLCSCLTGFSASDGSGSQGSLSDCGYTASGTTNCPQVSSIDCSGTGLCSGSPEYKCTCYEGYHGMDCSERLCPTGTAWFAEPGVSLPGFVSITTGTAVLATTQDLRTVLNRGDTVVFGEDGLLQKVSGIVSTVAGDAFSDTVVTLSSTYSGATLSFVEAYKNPNSVHDEEHLLECSGKGSCDTSTGTCTCESGFTGIACERLACPSDCNGHGLCLSLAQFAEHTLDNGELAGFSYGETFEKQETWDHGKVYGCLCDQTLQQEGVYDFMSIDCSTRRCTNGEDPSLADMPDSSKVEVQQAVCIATSGEFTLTFRQQTTGTLAFDVDATSLEAALETLLSIRDVSVSYTSGSVACAASPGVTITVQFLTELGDLPLLQADSTALAGTSPSITITESIAGTRVGYECSHRGNCDRSTGICTCFPGYVSSDGVGGRGNRGDCSYRDALFTG